MDAKFGSDGYIDTLSVSGSRAVDAGAILIAQQIRSRFWLKIGLYILAAVFLITAAALVVFAPRERESLSTVISLGLVIVAVGCAGFSTFGIKTALFSIDASTGQ